MAIRTAAQKQKHKSPRVRVLVYAHRSPCQPKFRAKKLAGVGFVAPLMPSESWAEFQDESSAKSWRPCSIVLASWRRSKLKALHLYPVGIPNHRPPS